MTLSAGCSLWDWAAPHGQGRKLGELGWRALTFLTQRKSHPASSVRSFTQSGSPWWSLLAVALSYQVPNKGSWAGRSTAGVGVSSADCELVLSSVGTRKAFPPTSFSSRLRFLRINRKQEEECPSFRRGQMALQPCHCVYIVICFSP